MSDLRKAAEMAQPEALRLADWLENEPGYDWNRNYCLAVAELRRLHEENEQLRQALAQPEQEPVAYDINGATVCIKPPVYGAAPPKREWVGLTDEDLASCLPGAARIPPGWRQTAQAIEAKLKEKNT